MVKIDQSLQYEKKEEKRSLKEYPCRMEQNTSLQITLTVRNNFVCEHLLRSFEHVDYLILPALV